jgi:hypothetical protein
MAGQLMQWNISLPPTVAANAGARTTRAAFNLYNPSGGSASTNAPTMMEEWLITALNIPVGIYIARASFATASTAQIVAELLYGGEPVWTGGLPVPLSQIEQNTLFSGIISASIENPIEVLRGRTLELGLTLTSEQTPIEQAIWQGYALPKAGENIVKQSTVSYMTKKLSGHKEL